MEHRIDPTRLHHTWDNRLEPTLRIASGDSVRYDLRMAGHGQIAEGDGYADTRLDFATPLSPPRAGPRGGRRAGDTLRIDILELTPGDWGWAAVLPGFGLLPDEFPEPAVWTFDLRGGGPIAIAPGVSIPPQPFLGTMGTHPDDPVTAAAFPPHKGGGTWTPVTCGRRDAAAAGLVRGRALQLRRPARRPGRRGGVRDGDRVPDAGAPAADRREALDPRAELPAAGPLTADVEGAGHHGEMGIDSDLMEGARKAVRATIDWLGAEHALSRVDAYLVCSLAGDLKIHEVVDSGVWNVGFTLPLSIFD